jgi:aryl-alcohol dehydrogenase-like predicted oxidoreductase
MEFSTVGLGCNNFGGRCDEEQSTAVVNAALDAGVTMFDTADVYGDSRSEEFLGRALAKAGRRDDVVIATKFGAALGEGGGGRPEYVRSAAEASLRRLGTDRIDLYQQHVPDATVPIEETLGALHELVVAGKVRAIGCSNVTSAMISTAAEVASSAGLTPFATVQNQYSLLERRPDGRVVPLCQSLGLFVLPYFPLASGLLTGKYRRGEAPPAGTRLASMPAERAGDWFTDRNFDVVERLSSFASSRGHSLLELAMSWLASRPAMGSIIAGATRPEQVVANVASASAWPLSAEELAEVDAITLSEG